MFRHLEEQGLYSKNELLNLLLMTVKGEAEMALQGILPNSNGYFEAWRILGRRFGDPLKIVQTHRKTLLCPSVSENNASQLQLLAEKVISLVSVLKSLGQSDDLLSDSYVDDVIENQMD